MAALLTYNFKAAGMQEMEYRPLSDDSGNNQGISVLRRIMQKGQDAVISGGGAAEALEMDDNAVIHHNFEVWNGGDIALKCRYPICKVLGSTGNGLVILLLFANGNFLQDLAPALMEKLAGYEHDDSADTLDFAADFQAPGQSIKRECRKPRSIAKSADGRWRLVK